MYQEKAPFPSLSLIIEWENQLLCDEWRPAKTLTKLSEQLPSLLPRLSGKPELIIVYDSDEVDKEQIERLMKENFTADHSAIDVRLLAAPGKRYYELKNEGAKVAVNDLLIFLDSDVIPENGWLEALLSSFGNPEVEIVGGNTYVIPKTIFQKAFAFFWFFPPRLAEENLHPYKGFFANNFAIPRNIFAHYSFQEIPLFRGQCFLLAHELKEKGYTIYRQPRAKADHPAPEGLEAFSVKALHDGHDIVYGILHPQKTGVAGFQESHKREKFRLKEILRGLKHRYRYAGLRFWELPAITAIIFVYFFVGAIGVAGGYLMPNLMRKHL